MQGNVRNLIAFASIFGAIAITHAAPGDTELVTPHFGPIDPYGGVLDVDVSADGRFVAFCPGREGDWAPNDTNGEADCMVRDRVAQKTVIATVSSSEVQGNNVSWFGTLSGDGRYLVFQSDASNLVPHDTNGRGDTFVRDLVAGVTERVSVRSDGSQLPGGSGYAYPSISADGRVIAFNAEGTVAVRDRLTRQTRFLKVGNPGNPLISPDGRFIAVKSYNQAKVIELATGLRDRIDRNSAGVGANSPSSYPTAISKGGRFVLFTSNATNLVPGDNNEWSDLFLRDRVLGTTERVSVKPDGTEFQWYVFNATMSDDGRFIAFTDWNNRSFDHMAINEIYLRDRVTKTVTRVNRNSNGILANRTSHTPALSADGRFIVFVSEATNLSPDDPTDGEDVYIRELAGVAAKSP
jgi:Tol biopolymer transport system component